MATDARSLPSLPASGPDSVYCTVFYCEPEFSALAEAELHALVGGRVAEPGVWLSPAPVRWAETSFARTGGRQLASGATLDALEEAVSSLDLAARTFHIEPVRVPRRSKGATLACSRIADCIDGDVDVDAPDVRFELVVSEVGLRLLIATELDAGDPSWLATSRKPHPYMVGLPVRIANAMIHLTARPGDSLLDPFCGSGTIPLLAAFAGLRAYGSDRSATWVERAGENIAHFGKHATLACVDARQTEQRADCIVTNLPYGRYSHLETDALVEVLRRIGRLAPRVTMVTSERIERELGEAGFRIESVLSVEPRRFERFVYVTRAPLG